MADNNPYEQRLHRLLDRDRQKPRWIPPRPALATADPKHLAVKPKPVPAAVLPRKEISMPQLTARSLKVSVVLQPAEVLALHCPETGRVPLSIRVDSRTVVADIAAKSLRKAQATITEHGPDGVACVIQGKLEVGDKVGEAGLVVQLKIKKADPVAA